MEGVGDELMGDVDADVDAGKGEVGWEGGGEGGKKGGLAVKGRRKAAVCHGDVETLLRDRQTETTVASLPASQETNQKFCRKVGWCFQK